MAAAYSVQHSRCGEGAARPFWYQLESYSKIDDAVMRARNYVLDNGGYVCVKNEFGVVVYGTDPAALNRSIRLGINRHFAQEAA